MPLLVIPAHDIDAAGIKIDVELPIAWLDRELGEADAKSAAPGRLSARLSRSGNDIVVRGEASTDAVLPCARCLGPTSAALGAELSLLLKPAPTPRPGAARGHPGAGSPTGKKAPSAEEAKGAMWAKAAARAIPEWDQAARGATKPPGAAGQGRGSSTGRKAKEAEVEFSSAEAELDTYDGETVVLDDFVREALLLELPNFPLCSEACPGIRPVAPASEAASGEPGERIDPRLAPLGALRVKLAAKLAKPKASTNTQTPTPTRTHTRAGKAVSPSPADRSPTRARAGKTKQKAGAAPATKKKTNKE